MIKPLAVLVLTILVIGAFFGWDYFKSNSQEGSPIKKLQQVVERPLDKYTYDALSKTDFIASAITFGNIVDENPKYTSRMFYFFDGDRKVSGLMNIPKSSD